MRVDKKTAVYICLWRWDLVEMIVQEARHLVATMMCSQTGVRCIPPVYARFSKGVNVVGRNKDQVL